MLIIIEVNLSAQAGGLLRVHLRAGPGADLP
jgi:hypothetical protein